MTINIREREVFKAGAEVEIQFLIPRLAADPGTPATGELWLNTTTGLVKFYDGTTIIVVGSALTTEAIQDIVGPFFGDSSDLDATYDDPGNLVSAVVKARTITFAKFQAISTGKILGRSTAASGDVEEITPTDTSTVNLTLAGGTFTADVLDSPTLEGSNLAAVIAAAISGAVTSIVDGAPSALDTLNEIAEALNDDAGAIDAILAALALRGRIYAEDLSGGSPTEDVDHGLALAQKGDFVARVFVKATGLEERYHLNPSTVNKIIVTDETGGNIPAGRRIFIVAGAS